MHMAGVGVVAFLFGLLTWERCGLSGCPNVQRLVAYQAEGGSVLLDRQDREFAVLRPVRREVVPLSSLPPYVGQAFIAIEDRRFRRHDGVDWPRVAGAAVANLAAGSVEQGASTITMQLARNAFPERLPATERTLRRKLLEARVARDIENRFGKEEILELYLNHIYFGGGAYGVEAASRYYFGKPAAELRQSQAALLAAIVKAPANYDPRRYPERARQRRNLVLDEMEKQELITAQEAAGSRNARLGVVAQPPFRGREEIVAAYFVEEIRKAVEERVGEQLYTSRLRIHTTLDVDAQRAAEEELVRQLQYIERGAYGRFAGPRLGTSDLEAPEGSPYLQGAVVMLEVRTGDVLALVGGRDYRVSTFNRAVRSKRQAGSSFKPFVFAAAIAEGYPPSQPIADEPFSVRLSANRSWEPENYDGDFYGMMSMREALVNSRNIPTVRLASAVGIEDITRTAQAAGIASDIPDQPSMALGAASVTPLEMTTAYATFASLGDAVRPRMIRWVEGDDGSVLWEEGVEARQAVDPAVAYVLTDILRDAVNYGTGAAVRAEGFGGPVAGKTGTTNDGRDAWFIGYTPDIVAGVWVGFDQPRPILHNASGGRVAAPIWGRMMRRVYRNRALPEDWRPPQTVVWRRIDPYTGRILSQGCWPQYGDPASELFIQGLLHESACPRSDQGRGLISSILQALGLGRDDERMERRGGRSRGSGDGRAGPEQDRLEEVLGAPPLGGIERNTQGRAASANGPGSRPDPRPRSRAERR
jgi:penicillin-binding protein 1A